MHKTKPLDHLILILGCLLMVTPVVVAFMTSTHEAAEIHSKGLMLSWGGHFEETYTKALTQKGGFTGEVTGARMLMNSFILGVGFAMGKIVLSMLAAYAIVYFRFRFATLSFWIIFTTLLLPLLLVVAAVLPLPTLLLLLWRCLAATWAPAATAPTAPTATAAAAAAVCSCRTSISGCCGAWKV